MRGSPELLYFFLDMKIKCFGEISKLMNKRYRYVNDFNILSCKYEFATRYGGM